MARPLRIEFPGAIYHVISRGDRRESIFEDDVDRNVFLTALGQALTRFDGAQSAKGQSAKGQALTLAYF